ncbi:putative Outer membrane protein [Helicobacter mustelae]|uniref:lipid A deacylase LpxR family protein n=1 Tax=Helicobacter mustelae TaxID=217 RepID=UPI000DF99B66|nr:lipid A deacylase LpxR family protein [Helicobacter mustelae]STP12695.1 putative Outer membrane protein [Helicobacter mustelae]
MKKIALLFFISHFSFAENLTELQTKEPSTESPNKETPKKESNLTPYHKSFFTIITENDAYLNAHVDRFYTAGTNFNYTSKEYLNSWLGYLSYDFRSPKASRWQIAINQDLYTPISRKANPGPKTHPYAGYLSLNFLISQRRENSIEDLQLQIGVVGPDALGKQTQALIHHLTHNPIFYGWNRQLKNEFILNLTYEYIHRFTLLDSRYFSIDVLPGLKVALGNAKTFAGFGGRLRMGYNLKSDFGVEKVNTGFLGSKPYNDAFSFYVFGGVSGSYVIRNIFIQGNSFGPPTDLSLEHFIYDLEFGASIMYKGFRFSYVITRLSKQFQAQRGAHSFGSIVLSFAF